MFVSDEVPISPLISSFGIHSGDLFNRMVSVLRLKKGDSVQFFNHEYHTRAHIKDIQKKLIIGEFENISPNVPYTPVINWILPLIEKDAFEEAISFLTILGAHSIIPVSTRKTHRAGLSEKELIRCHRIMVASAEQSKQFVFPIITEARAITNLKEHMPGKNSVGQPHTNRLIFFDPQGESAWHMTNMLKKNPREPITCMVGPEGDLTIEEKTASKNLDLNRTHLRNQFCVRNMR